MSERASSLLADSAGGARLGMSRFSKFLSSIEPRRVQHRPRSVLERSSPDRAPFVCDRSISDSFVSDRIAKKPHPHAPQIVPKCGGLHRPSLADVIEAERSYLFGNDGPTHRPGTAQRDEMSRFGSRLVTPQSNMFHMSALRKNALEFAREKQNQSANDKGVKERRSSITKKWQNGLKCDTFTVAEPKHLFEMSQNISPSRSFPEAASNPISQDTAPAHRPGQASEYAAVSRSSPPPMQDLPAIQHIDCSTLYNIVVDGTVGHIILDTRDDEKYDDCHVRGAVDLAEALTYSGRHIILVGTSSRVSQAERAAVHALEKSERAMSFKMLEGGSGAFEAAYPFFCEPTASSRDLEFKRMRERRLHIYPSQVLPSLYIGGIESAADEKIHSDLGLTHMVSIIAKPEKVRPPLMCQQLKLPLRDEEDQDIEALFKPTQAFLSQCVEGGGKVLIHCKMGRSRSATLVLMWMVYHHGFTLAAAWQRLKSCRRQIGLNAGFTRTLIEFERKHSGVATVSWSQANGLKLHV